MTGKLFILGAGGHAKMVLEVARSQGYLVECCMDAPSDCTQLLGVPVIQESEEKIKSLGFAGVCGFVAIGSNSLRRKLCHYLHDLGIQLPTLISPGAYISPSSEIGPGTVVMPGAVVGASARIGAGAIINTSASVDHDCLLGDFVHIAPGTHLAGNVTVGSQAFLGVGVSVIPEMKIGHNSVVGAGAVVVSEIPDEEVWVGVPAKPLKRLHVRKSNENIIKAA